MRSGLPALGGGESSGQIRMSTHLYSKRKVCNLIFLGYKLIIRGETENEENVKKDFIAINYGYDSGDISGRRGVC